MKTSYKETNAPLQKEHFVFKKGDNPSDKVMRNGKWVNIQEHNRTLVHMPRPN